MRNKFSFKPTITKDELNLLPVKSFEGEILLIDTIEKLDRALPFLYKESTNWFELEITFSGVFNSWDIFAKNSFFTLSVFSLSSNSFSAISDVFLWIKSFIISIICLFSSIEKGNAFTSTWTLFLSYVINSY